MTDNATAASGPAGTTGVDKTTEHKNWILWVILALMATASIVAIVVGGSFYTIAVSVWIDRDFTFKGWDFIAWLVGMAGAGGIHLGLLIAGFIFRMFSWSKAPLLSFGLAVATVPYILFNYVMFNSPTEFGDGAQTPLMVVGGIFSLAILTLPPFLHWLNAPRIAAAPAVQPNRSV